MVGRSRPDVPELTTGLPVAASWPSGHSAAAVAVCGALAAIAVLRSRSRWRWSFLVLPVLLPPLIGLSRIYVAAHHPTDVHAGLTLGTLWLLACVRYVLLDGDGESDDWRTSGLVLERPRQAGEAAGGAGVLMPPAPSRQRG